MSQHTRLTRSLLALVLLVLSAPQRAPAIPVDPTCTDDFRMLVSLVSEDYAGFVAKTSSRPNEYRRRLETSASLAESAADTACTAILRGWIAFFADRHLSLIDSHSRRQVSRPRNNMPTLEVEGAFAILRVPSFGAQWKRSLDSLLQSHAEIIATLPNLILDVRGNTGGGAGTYASLIPILYTDSILKDDFETLASPGNIVGLTQIRSSGVLPGEVMQEIDSVIATMNRNPGTFVRPYPERYIARDSALTNPRHVAILFDNRCVSACELFVLDARASRKVITIGSSFTGGVLDYGDVRQVSLPSGFRRVGIPTARSRRLPKGALDNIGIAPDVLETAPDTDLVSVAKTVLAQLN